MMEMELESGKSVGSSKSTRGIMRLESLQLLPRLVDGNLRCVTVPFDFNISLLICINLVEVVIFNSIINNIKVSFQVDWTLIRLSASW